MTESYKEPKMTSLLSLKDLSLHFKNARDGEIAVRNISFDVAPGEIVGLVGESGSGKSVTAISICGLTSQKRADISGQIFFEDRDILNLSESALREYRGLSVGVVFQEPMTSMNPLRKIGVQIEEPLKIHTKLSKKERYQKAIEAMHMAELDDAETVYDKYPHELSGGMLQRCMIASAIITKPKLLIADEPTTALDVTIQAQIIELLKKLNKENGMAILFISHDLNVVKKLCSKVIVMKSGNIVEVGKMDEIFDNPREDYTKSLIAAIPTRDKRMF